jgi:single-strand DNA-binding protein
MAVFGDLNEVRLIGNITQDINLRHTNGGTAVTSFGLATNRNYKQGDDWKEEVTFHNIVVWGNDAEYLTQKAKKGTRIFVSGRLQTRSWDDQEGKKNYKTEVVAEKIILIDRYERGGEPKPKMDGEPENYSGNQSPKSKSKQMENEMEDTINPDDLPF